MERDDTALVRACRAGDQEAWEQLIRRYQRLVYSIPLRAGLDDDSAAEVFQRVFTVLFEKLDTLAQPERLRSWLVTTARRESIVASKRQRRTTRFPESEDDAESIDLPDPGLLPGEELERLELLFFRSDSPPYAEVAAALGMREGSIGPTRARCLEKLRSRVDELGL
jgi:DNA-directed RNA polymerase specialized sigma24 family protein